MKRILALGMALIAAEVAAQPSELKIAPSPLLLIDQHRQSVIDGIVATWRETLQARHGDGVAQRETEFRAQLMGLRSDRLLAASVAGSLFTVEMLLADSDVTAATRGNAKGLGSATTDLLYTPLTPCRIADTRYAGGALQANTPRTLVGYNASSFAGQGGTATNCGIPPEVAALAMNAFAVNPSNLGFIKLYAANSPEPAVSTVNYQPGITAIATGTIVPVDAANANQFIAKSPAQVDLIVDVVGYFKSPGIGNITGFGSSTVAGGLFNTASASQAFIGGGISNNVTALAGTIAGGQSNVANGAMYATIGGGYGNNAYDSATVGGGMYNSAAGQLAAIGGGFQNTASGQNAYIGGGWTNTASSNYATIGGGSNNVASGGGAVIAGGNANYADGSNGAVGGGGSNSAAGDYAAVAGGAANLAYGMWAMVPGGSNNEAAGMLSFAGGNRAKTRTKVFPQVYHAGAFVWADTTQADFNSTADDEFSARARGGVRFVTATDFNGVPTAGVALAAGSGTWTSLSDRAAKDELAAVDAASVLESVVALPVYTWRYRTEASGARHMGPVSQDFRAAFDLGADDKSIAVVDADGVALAAIQGLNRKVTRQAKLIEELQRRLEALERR